MYSITITQEGIIAIVKKLKQHPPLPPSRYEVGIYCRVSTASKTQVVSIGHQLFGLIADVANSQQARLYDVYLDIQSGRTSDNRKNLMRLLDDCRTGRVTLVYTKSISRFARNTVDVLTIVRELKKMNVPVYFENEQLYSFDKEAELAISLHGAIAQGESENKSENIKWSLDKAAQNPDAQIYNRKCYGYSNAEDGSLVINEPEAEVIRQIFQMYLDGYSVEEIDTFIEAVETSLYNIKQEKISGDNVYQFLLFFDNLYDRFTDMEKKIFMKRFLEEGNIYEAEQEDGRILRSLKFRFPVFFNEQELYELDWDNESTVESVLLMRRAKR